MGDDDTTVEVGAPGGDPHETVASAPRPRHTALVLLVAVAVVAAVVVGAILGLGGSGPSVAAAAVVREASRATLAAHSSDLTLSGSVVANGQTLTLSGSGALDLTQRTGQIHLTASGPAVTTTDDEVISGDQAYVSFTAGTTSVSTLVPGKSWLALPLPAAASPSSGAGGLVNVLAALKLLQSQGATVTSLGASTIDGVNVNGYGVTLPTSTLLAAARRATAAEHLPAAEARVALQAVRTMTMGLSVWVDDANLLRRLDLSVTATTNGTALDETMRIDLSNYGAPVSVSVPPASEVATLAQFQAALARLRGAGG
ncbi:MAG TPA: hypothetical protein PLS29_08010 [Acidimicrobiales bacterium]|nr:MAG: hypothetical protein B7Z69_08415 [Actinobacteria bacterium 21-73-9]HQU26957.1 hypothetical protein [Acidimicrobiales bacterium]